MTLEPNGRLSRRWRRVPLALRATLEGLGVMAVGVWSWPIVLVTVPLPWSPLVMVILLGIYWEFFTGRRWRATTAEDRKLKSRSGRLTIVQLAWGLLAAGAFVVIVQASFVVTFRVVSFPAETFTSGFDLDAATPATAWMIIAVSSLVAAICEEMGFRGYMQVLFESRYSPVAAIAITSIFFALVHLGQPWATAILPHIFLLSVLLGILANASQSLLPAIVAHAILDVVNFSYWWSDVAGRFERQPISEVGVDVHFAAWLAMFAIGLGTFAWSIRELQTTRGSAPTRAGFTSTLRET